ncbi:chromosomal replication initiator protein DnaA [Candidatus Microgenomates bacterium]|nr:chromosomal replication initiator protein DnaA [Candidatus Microgenomates bacterium]
MDKDILWQNVLAELELTLTKGTFQTFFKDTSLESIESNVATISCSSAYLRTLIETRYYSLLKTSVDRLTKNNNSLVFVVSTKTSKADHGPLGPLFAVEEQEPGIETAARKAHLHPGMTFKNFAVSSSNHMAFAAAQAVAEKPGTSYNPLFFYGGVGVGKTHLMQAVGHTLLSRNPNTKIIYCLGEEFTNEIIEAIREKNTKIFKGKYRSVQALLIDDIQFIAGKTTVQEEFFHTFNILYREGAQIILTSDKPPSEINRLEERLRSRFEGGLIIDIQSPDFELRTAILLIKATSLSLPLPMDVAQLIAANIEDTRRLEGFLRRLTTEIQTRKTPLTPEVVRHLLGTDEKEEKRFFQNVSFKEIVEGVASHYGLRINQIKGPKRDRPIALPRQILYYLLRTELGLTLEEIGEICGGRDHTTILHGIEKITKLLPESEKIRQDILVIKQAASRLS